MLNQNRRQIQTQAAQVEKPKVGGDPSTSGEMDSKPEVQCEECSRWVFLDKTPFEDLVLADKSPFQCRICERMATTKKEQEQSVEQEKQARRKVEAELAALKEEHTIFKQEVSRMIDRVGEEVRALKTERDAQKRGKEMTLPADKAQEYGQRNPEKTMTVEDQECGSASLALSNTPTTSGQAGRDNKTDLTDHKVPSVQQPQEEGWTLVTNSKKKARTNKTRKVVVAGDSNIRRIKALLLDVLEWDLKFTVTALLGAKAKAVIDTLKGKEHTEETLVIMHAGLNDLLDGATPQETAEAITEGLTKMLGKYPYEHYGVCSVPMVPAEEPGIRENIRSLNLLLKETCKKLGPRTQFLNSFWITRRMKETAMRGIHFTEAGGKAVGHWLP